MLKGFADNTIGVIQKLKFDFGKIKKKTLWKKEKNAGYQHFLLFPTMFSKGVLLGLCGKEFSFLFHIGGCINRSSTTSCHIAH